MKAMESISFNSFKEYTLFLYVHIAYADGEMHKMERELIVKRIQHLFPEEADPNKRLDNVLQTYINNTDSADKIIASAHKQFASIEFYKKYRVFMDLYNIINADGIVSESEKEAMEKLKKIIGLEANQSGLTKPPTD